jgi:ferredoxin/flavodoxin---NADP+ reductase
MAYAITQSCCTDAACVSACPVNCIHPTPDEPGFATTDMLHVDPAACIDCGACADACPVDAVRPVDLLPASQAVYAERNSQYFDRAPAGNSWARPRFPRSLPASAAAPRIAVVGTGPAAGYTVQALLRCTDSDITLLDRHPVPGGLIRFGVAPDHPATKRIADSFAAAYRHPRVRLHLGVDVGHTVSHAELLEHHHAVIYATGADRARTLGIPGEDLPGSLAATDFLAWCNGLPRIPPDATGLSAGRAVVVGNGNVALDVTRLLLTDHQTLATTGIAAQALAALRASTVSEVVLLGRRGPAHAAWTPSEFLGLQQIPGLQITVDGDGDVAGEIAAADRHSPLALLRGLPVAAVDWTAPPAAGTRLVLRFHSAPIAARGSDRVQALRVSDRDAGERDIPAGLLIRSAGSRGAPISGLPFDPDTGVIPNAAGRVRPGSYVVGWAKRGSTGGIGTNRACAAETVDALLDDAAAGRLPAPTGTAKAFARLVRHRGSRASTAPRPDNPGLRWTALDGEYIASRQAGA